MPASVMFLTWCLVVAARAHVLPATAEASLDLAEVVKMANDSLKPNNPLKMHTVCPIVTEVDDVPGRIPRRIKTIKCAKEPHLYCATNHIPSYECCGRQDSQHRMSCVDITDVVVVRYVQRPELTTLTVPVGCACLVSPRPEGRPVTSNR